MNDAECYVFKLLLDGLYLQMVHKGCWNDLGSQSETELPEVGFVSQLHR